MDQIRCAWAKHPLEVDYHDHEWGVPKHDDRRLFEDLVLDGAQAGLSWLTILKKREGYRAAFDQFDFHRVALYGPDDVERLLADPGIVRNRQKVQSAIVNAQAFLKVREEFGTFDAYLWSWVDGKPIVNRWASLSELPARTDLSDRLSKDLQRRGFKFVGSTIVYAMMQAIGLVNDHTTDCFRHTEV